MLNELDVKLKKKTLKYDAMYIGDLTYVASLLRQVLYRLVTISQGESRWIPHNHHPYLAAPQDGQLCKQFRPVYRYLRL